MDSAGGGDNRRKVGSSKDDRSRGITRTWMLNGRNGKERRSEVSEW